MYGRYDLPTYRIIPSSADNPYIKFLFFIFIFYINM
jgi:hypothetical protein